MEEGGAYYVLAGTVSRGPCSTPFQVVKRDCGDHFEFAPLGFFILADGSLMTQAPIRRQNNVVELRLTWLSPEAGPVRLPPLVYKIPKNMPPNFTCANQLPPGDQEKKEAFQRFRALINEACAKYGIKDHRGAKIELELVNAMQFNTARARQFQIPADEKLDTVRARQFQVPAVEMAAVNVPLFEGFISVDDSYHVVGLRSGSHMIDGTQYIGHVYHNNVPYGVFAIQYQQQQEADPNAAAQQRQVQPNNGMDINGNA